MAKKTNVEWTKNDDGSTDVVFNIEGLQGTVKIFDETGVPNDILCINLRVAGGKVDPFSVLERLKKITDNLNQEQKCEC